MNELISFEILFVMMTWFIPMLTVRYKPKAILCLLVLTGDTTDVTASREGDHAMKVVPLCDALGWIFI